MLLVVPAVLVLNGPSFVFTSGSQASDTLQSVDMGLWQPCTAGLTPGQGLPQGARGGLGKAAAALAWK